MRLFGGAENQFFPPGSFGHLRSYLFITSARTPMSVTPLHRPVPPAMRDPSLSERSSPAQLGPAGRRELAGDVAE